MFAQYRIDIANGRFYTRDVEVVWTHLTSETLKPSGIIKVLREQTRELTHDFLDYV